MRLELDPQLPSNPDSPYAQQLNRKLTDHLRRIASIMGQVQTKMDTFVHVSDYGARPGTNDQTSAIQAAIDDVSNAGGGVVELGDGYYATRNLVVKSKVILRGKGKEASKLYFASSGNDASDASAYVVQVFSDRGGLMSMGITGLASGAPQSSTAVCNGVRLTPTGELPLFYDVRLDYFAGYKAGAAGGSLGLRGNFARADMTDDAGNFLLTGGNGFVTDTTSANSHLFMSKLEVYYCDNEGIYTGLINDSWFDFVVGYCGSIGFDMSGTTLGVPSNVRANGKVFLCNTLNLADSPTTMRTRVIPSQATLSAETDRAAAVITGRGHRIMLEAQENGSSGVQLGTRAHTLSLTRLDLVVDGNGGYDTTAAPATQAAYRRSGTRELNAYRNTVIVSSGDFRARYNWQRQLRATSVESTPPSFNSANTPSLTVGDWYKITSAAGGADFTGSQLGVASPSNAIGTIFEGRLNNTVSGNPSIVWGAGTLSAVNDDNVYIVNTAATYEEDQNISDGTFLDGEGGGSTFIVNGEVAQRRRYREVSAAASSKLTDSLIRFTGGGGFTWTLTQVKKGKEMTLHNTSAGVITLAVSAGALVGAGSLAAGEMAYAYSDGANWNVKKFA